MKIITWASCWAQGPIPPDPARCDHPFCLKQEEISFYLPTMERNKSPNLLHDSPTAPKGVSWDKVNNANNFRKLASGFQGIILGKLCLGWVNVLINMDYEEYSQVKSHGHSGATITMAAKPPLGTVFSTHLWSVWAVSLTPAVERVAAEQNKSWELQRLRKECDWPGRKASCWSGHRIGQPARPG